MPFTTLNDKDCLVRKPLIKFKWTDVTGATNGTALQNKAQVEQALDLAKQSNLVNAYAKVGVIKGGKLVFRIKHKGGHWGKKDIILAQGFASDAGGDATVAAQITGGGQPQLTTAWWNGVAANVENGDELTAGLTKYESNLKLLQRQAGFASFETVLGAIQDVQDAARSLAQQLKNPADKSVLLKVMKTCRTQEKAIREQRLAYAGKLLPAHAVTLCNTGGFVGDDLDKVEGYIRNMKQQVRTGDLQNANRESAKIAKGLLSSPAEGNAFREHVKSQAEREGVIWEDLFKVASKHPARAKARQRFKNFATEFEKTQAALNVAEDAITDHEYDHPENTANTDPTYQRNLRTINAGFKGVLTAIQDGLTYAGQRMGPAQAILKNAQRAAPPGNVPTAAETIFDQLMTRKDVVVAEYSKIRSASGSLKVEEASYNLSADDKKKFTTPILNRCMSVWYNYRFAERQVLETLDEAMKAYLVTVPDSQEAQDLRAQLKLRLKGLES